MVTSATPRLRVELACQRLGRSEVIKRCTRVLGGDLDDAGFVVTLGGTHAVRLLTDGIPAGQDYWFLVWAARGLLWAGPGDDLEELRVALGHDAWRVREMACKVVARHRVGSLLREVVALEADPVPRVRRAATRAVVRIAEAHA